jgi:hypothetical protein
MGDHCDGHDSISTADQPPKAHWFTRIVASQSGWAAQCSVPIAASVLADTVKGSRSQPQSVSLQSLRSFTRSSDRITGSAAQLLVASSHARPHRIGGGLLRR